MEKHFRLLGFKVKDAVTGIEGVAESICFDLYGCVQVAVRPSQAPDAKVNEYPDGRWFDIKRLTVVSDAPVMPVPDFNKPEIGAAAKPAFSSMPSR